MAMTRGRLLIHPVCMAGLMLAAATISSQQLTAPTTWKTTPGSVALERGGRTVWQFNYDTKAVGKPHFHPLRLPGGPTLTWQRPADHPWHYGHWFSWKYLNRVNYWEENRKTGLSPGATRVSQVEVETRPDHSARMTMNLTYAPPDHKAVLTEKRILEVSPPATDGTYHIDWTMTFTAGPDDVVLDRTPLLNEPGGKVYGGYAGLSIRLARGVTERRAVVSTGKPVTFKRSRHRCRASALDMSGILDGHTAGLAVLDHPDNLNAPSPWYVNRSKVMTFFTPAVLCYSPHTLAAGSNFTLRYRVVVHAGRYDAARLRTLQAAYAAEARK